jgi:phosphopantothenoylcysteine decarboxylase/phosphopantothenate--cysteine ligase
MARTRTNPRLARLRVLVTAGPTRERIDPVRFLSNDSSGRMGFAIAEAAARAGHDVVLVAGPVALATPKGVRRIDVESARDMLAALKKEWRAADALYMAAAVADWRPAQQLAGKWRAKDRGAKAARIDLVRNPDVIAALTRGRRDPERIVFAFALETGNGERRARLKLAKKGADWIVLNGPSALDSDTTRLVVIGANGVTIEVPERTKRAAARDLVALLRG